MTAAITVVALPTLAASGRLRVASARRPATMGAVAPVHPDPEPTPAGPSRAAAALERAAAGDEAAFGEFYDEVAPVVFGTARRVLRNQAMAEEVTQDVFVELWRQAPRFDPGRGSPRSWAATIAHRRAVDRVRAEQSARTREDVDARRVRPEHDEVADQVAADLDRSEVAAALDQLSAAQQEAVRLAFYDGHTYREVAALLDLPEGTVKTRIRDGLIKLRGLMGATR